MKVETFWGPREKAVLGMMAFALCFCSDALPREMQKTIAVSRFENKTLFGAEIGEGMADQLADALVRSGQFAVVDRLTMADVIAEQDWATSGRMQASEFAQTGKLLSVQFHIKGTITEFVTQSSGSDSRVNIGGFRVGGKQEKAHVGLLLQLIDTTSGRVLLSERVEEKATASGVDVSGTPKGIEFGTESFIKTPLGKATQGAIDKAVDLIVRKLRNVPYECSVVKADGEEVIISTGQRNGAQSGDIFDIYDRQEELIDPVTGESLGGDEAKIGAVEIYQVEEKFSRAKVLSSSKDIQRGYIARLK